MQGLQLKHAYSVASVHELAGTKLLKVRNSTGNKIWTGDWSPGSKKWDLPGEWQLLEGFEDDCQFMMCYADYLE